MYQMFGNEINIKGKNVELLFVVEHSRGYYILSLFE